MNISCLKTSRFLKKEDCSPPILATIRGDVSMENVAAEGAPIEEKACLHFEELDKPLVLNSTNAQIIAAITGSPLTENWNGLKLVLYHDPAIMFSGKMVGGVRVRAARLRAPTAPAPLPAQPGADEIDIPY